MMKSKKKERRSDFKKEKGKQTKMQTTESIKKSLGSEKIKGRGRQLEQTVCQVVYDHNWTSGHICVDDIIIICSVFPSCIFLSLQLIMSEREKEGKLLFKRNQERRREGNCQRQSYIVTHHFLCYCC